VSERKRNPRGQGERLREDIVTAASEMLADPAAPPLTLRGVARAVGVAATSVYLHFDSVESLVLEVARRGFRELRAAQDAAMEMAAGPCERLRAGSMAYCEWGLANPGHYQWMFANPMRISVSTWEQLPGRPMFAALVARVAECLGRPDGDPESARTARLLWHLLHGMVSLRIARPFLPWPPIEDTVDEAVARIVTPARLPPGSSRAPVPAGRRT
jgi:AcrR family transcriptional regulator